LLADGVEVLALVLPEVELFHGGRVVAVLEGVFGVLLENVLNLLAPLDDSAYIN
jgi:hypothetical protein